MADQPLDLSKSTGHGWWPNQRPAHSGPRCGGAAPTGPTRDPVGHTHIPDIHGTRQSSDDVPLDFSARPRAPVRVSVAERIAVVRSTGVDPCPPAEPADQQQRRGHRPRQQQQQRQYRQHPWHCGKQPGRLQQQQQRQQRQPTPPQTEARHPRIRSVVRVPPPRARTDQRAAGGTRAGDTKCGAHGRAPSAQPKGARHGKSASSNTTVGGGLTGAGSSPERRRGKRGGTRRRRHWRPVRQGPGFAGVLCHAHGISTESRFSQRYGTDGRRQDGARPPLRVAPHVDSHHTIRRRADTAGKSADSDSGPIQPTQQARPRRQRKRGGKRHRRFRGGHGVHGGPRDPPVALSPDEARAARARVGSEQSRTDARQGARYSTPPAAPPRTADAQTPCTVVSVTVAEYDIPPRGRRSSSPAPAKAPAKFDRTGDVHYASSDSDN